MSDSKRQKVEDISSTADSKILVHGPDEWEKRVSKSTGRDFWFNKLTGQSVWENPMQNNATATNSLSAHISDSSSMVVPSRESDAGYVDDIEWKKIWSDKHQAFYWWNKKTNTSVWKEPPLPASHHEDNKTSATNAQSQILRLLETERIKFKISKTNHTDQDIMSTSNAPTISTITSYDMHAKVDCPRLVDKFDTAALQGLFKRLLIEDATVAAKAGSQFSPRMSVAEGAALKQPLTLLHSTESMSGGLAGRRGGVDTQAGEYDVVFTLADDDVALLSRALQEDMILKTKLKLRKPDNSVVDLPSFWEVWFRPDAKLRSDILASPDPHEAKWKLSKTYGYKIATTFMPGYAKALYKYFDAKMVLDPCAGWGDRLLGALGARATVTKYVAFDPNLSLRPGYCDIMTVCGNPVASGTENHLQFVNGFEIHSKAFEVGSAALSTNSFDLVFTSPPFFDYEMYTPANPQYKDWLKEFYYPLMTEACRCVKLGKFVAIHIGDTSAGSIEPFLKQTVHTLCPLKLVAKLGLRGVMSDQLRPVWVFQKLSPFPASMPAVVSYGITASSSVNVIESRSDMLLSKARIHELLNPPIRLIPLNFRNQPFFTVLDDSVCVGGTKQRLLSRLIPQIIADKFELIYAGPDSGAAQVALAYAAKLFKLQATVFLNTPKGTTSLQLPPLAWMAQQLGAKLTLSESNTGRSLADTQQAAEQYASADPRARMLLPFGMDNPLNRQLFEEAIREAVPADLPPPARLWVVAGSGFLFRVLHNVWPKCKLMITQVGKKIWPDQLEGIDHELFIAPERFGDNTSVLPPYKSLPWYDAKLWQFAKIHGQPGDYIWNVAGLPDNIPDYMQFVFNQLHE